MEKSIEYALLKVEEAYYGQNADIRIRKGSCLLEEGLYCNCLTGIAINYIGYLVSLCRNIKDCTVYFQADNPIGHIRVKYKEKMLMPVMLEEIGTSDYYLSNRICNKRKADQKEHARIVFRRYSSREELGKKVLQAEEIMQEINEEKGIEYCYRFKFWIPFAAALRARSLEESCKAFLAMAIFMFPNRTLRFVCQAIETDISNKAVLKQVKEFLKNYSDFLEGLECVGGTFPFHDFCREFKKLTSINISYFIEDIIHNPKVPDAEEILCEIFSKALYNNLREKKERRGALTKAISILNERESSDVCARHR